MLRDIGFWNIKGEYIEDYQEVGDEEMALSINDINKLEQENTELKAEIKELKKYQYEQEYLDKEIEEMQKALKTLAEGLNKRQMLLQEIKAIVCSNGEIIDTQGRKDILKLINKAEEE